MKTFQSNLTDVKKMQPMKTFLIKFNGRKKNALGRFSNFVETVEAQNKSAAILKLYEKYEHIYDSSVEEIKP